MNRSVFLLVAVAALALSSAGSVGAQTDVESAPILNRGGQILFAPASNVFGAEGQIKGAYARVLGESERDEHGAPTRIGRKAKMWQARSQTRFGSAASLGYSDGDLPNSRVHCYGDEMRSVSRGLRERLPPEEFEAWAAQTEALIQGRVAAVAPGFNRHGDPEMLVSVAVERHLYPPKKPFAQQIRILMGVGEFVAGDAVFCGKQTWGGYRPRIADRLIVAAFGSPLDEEHSLIGSIDPNRVFLVAESGDLLRLNRSHERRRVAASRAVSTTEKKEEKKDGFPTTFTDLVDRVRVMWDSGALDGPSFADLFREERRRAPDHEPEWR